MTVLITGGNRGIGLETTRLFIAMGADVHVVARHIADYEFYDHPQVNNYSFDLSETDKLPQLLKVLPDLDILINNAGLMYGKGVDDYDTKMRDYLMQLNLYTPVALMEAMRDKMPKGGRIVNNASVAAHTGHPDVWYGMSKAALLNATKSFAKILAPNNIMVTAVSPSPVDTHMQNVNSPERKEAFKQSVLSKRFATAEEIAKSIVWLATEAPEYLNASSLDLNDGSYMR